MTAIFTSLRRNRALWITLLVSAFMLIAAMRGMEAKDSVLTLLRGLSTGAIIFLVASGFSLIFGLMDVLNLAHGALFMLGAYIGWTAFVRPDTTVDMLTPVALLVSGFLLMPLWTAWLKNLRMPALATRVWPWAALLLGLAVLAWALPKYPVTAWDVGSYEQSPTNYAFAASQGLMVVPEPKQYRDISPLAGLGGIVLGSMLASAALAGFGLRRAVRVESSEKERRWPWKSLVYFALLVLAGIGFFVVNTPLTEYLLGLDTTWLFLIAVVVAVSAGAGLGALMESTLVRPLYVTPVYILMLTLGISGIMVEVVREVWGAPEFTMHRPSIFAVTSGDGCPAQTIWDVFQYKCATIEILGGRVRTYNELFIPLLGLLVLLGVWLLLQRTRLGMIVRAGVQDSEMVEALGINVRSVFTLVFAIGVGLAALGGVVGAPSTGLTTTLGDSLLINMLVALAIGGLTSYPGAFVGSLMVGLLQQFIIKYGQLGIQLPFLAEPFKPTPPLIPASTVLLMVIILLVMPQGLFGRKD